MSAESIKVLLVEDNLGDARLLYEGMEEALPGQFRMAHVRRLSETLEYLWEGDCNVVLLDLGLPDSHGLDTLVLVRAQAPDVPIVVLTGFDDEEMGDRTLHEGAQDFLVKGQVDSKVLARSMRYAIARKAAELALVHEKVALAKADDLQRSRQRLIAVHERVRREVAAQLLAGPPSDERRATLGRRLYPETLDRGLVPTFRALGARHGGAPAIEIVLDDELVRQEEADPGLFPEPVGLALYRIAEEALANVVKHAKAGKVTLRLEPPQPGWWRLSVKDDGQGFLLASVPLGLGLATMQDYAQAQGGECVIESEPGVGTVITAALPLSGSDGEPSRAAEKGVN
jgi:signal transduction histidine kinase